MNKGFRPPSQGNQGSVSTPSGGRSKGVWALLLAGATSFAGYQAFVAPTPKPGVTETPQNRAPASQAAAPAETPQVPEPLTHSKPEKPTEVAKKQPTETKKGTETASLVQTQAAPAASSTYSRPSRFWNSSGSRGSYRFARDTFRPSAKDRARFRRDKSLKDFRASLKERRSSGSSGGRRGRTYAGGNAERFKRAAASLQEGGFTSGRAHLVTLLTLAASAAGTVTLPCPIFNQEEGQGRVQTSRAPPRVVPEVSWTSMSPTKGQAWIHAR